MIIINNLEEAINAYLERYANAGAGTNIRGRDAALIQDFIRSGVRVGTMKIEEKEESTPSDNGKEALRVSERLSRIEEEVERLKKAFLQVAKYEYWLMGILKLLASR